MKRLGLNAAVGLGLFITVGLLTVESAYAGEPTCTLKTLRGRYLFALTGTLGGVTVLENAVAPFSYVVNEDCTGSFAVTNGPSFSIFIAPDGDSFSEITTAPLGNGVADIARRVSQK